MEVFGLDLKDLLAQIGLWGIFVIIFVESGLLVGFFLPGDSLLLTAGLLASQGYFGIGYLLIGSTIGAILGDSTGYYLGRRFGRQIFNRKESVLFHRDNLVRAERFYTTYGPLSIVLARFVPFVRSFAPILAGIGQMPYRKFLAYNIFGGLLWVLSLGLLGFYLGSTVPNIDRIILPIIGVIVVVSILLVLVSFLRRPTKASG